VVYPTYLVVGVVFLCGLLLLYLATLTESENAAWVAIGLLGICYFLLAPLAAILAIIALFGGVDWRLVVLLIATLILLGIVCFFLFVLGYLSYPTWFVLFHVCYAIVALALPIWHFSGERRKRAAVVPEIRAAKKTDTHE
jgi:amino acid transporter